MGSTRKKPSKENENMIIRGMKLNIENKVIAPRANPMRSFKKDSLQEISAYTNIPFKSYEDLQANAFREIDKDQVFHNKHIVSVRLQSLVGISHSRGRSLNPEEPVERMFKFGDVKSKWERLGRGE
ncbi:hypothetical protein NGRA_0691 [Nosema granulosis]|uniref:Uncharacterized protein n=1 Tax=Nosema granulosis TaxID=83296 RepID=A0A9P6H1I8_9MICR|nr:hypothetical protein NGRA_0691 [Nosema granulosis]